MVNGETIHRTSYDMLWLMEEKGQNISKIKEKREHRRSEKREEKRHDGREKTI